jgi:quinol monooxygenase YgiN
MEKFAILVIFKIFESKVSEFHKALQFHSENTWSESGSIKFVSYSVENDPSTIFLYELYENRAAFEAHTKTDYIVKFRDMTSALHREPAVIYRGVPVFANPSSPKGAI